MKEVKMKKKITFLKKKIHLEVFSYPFEFKKWVNIFLLQNSESQLRWFGGRGSSLVGQKSTFQGFFFVEPFL